MSDRLVYVKKVFVDRLSILTDMVEANFSMFVRAYRNEHSSQFKFGKHHCSNNLLANLLHVLDNASMTETPKSPSQAIVSATKVAEHLARELGGKASHWSIWLANDRKPGRVNRRLQQEPGPGRPRYNASMVDAFVAEYKKEHLQSSPSQIDRVSSRDKRFAPTIAALKAEDGAEKPAVLLVIPKPLQAFILTAEEARRIASRLLNAANEIDPGTS